MKWFKFVIIIFVAIIFSGCNPLAKNSKSGLQVITDNVESSIFLDGQYLEKSPFINREIKPGEYVLKIQPDDPSLVAYETRVRLRPGLLTVITWKLANRPELSGGVIYEMEPIKSKSKSEVSFITIPDGAIVSLEGKDKDFSPVIISNVNPGHNEFEISLPSYESQKHTINVVAGYRMIVNVKLAKVGVGEFNKKTIKTDSETATEDHKQENTDKTATKSSEINNTATDSGQINNTATQAATIGDQILINSTNFFNDGKEVLRVRDKAGSTGKELGFAIVGTKYKYLDSVDNWFKISFNNKPGWVSGTYAQVIKSN